MRGCAGFSAWNVGSILAHAGVEFRPPGLVSHSAGGITKALSRVPGHPKGKALSLNERQKILFLPKVFRMIYCGFHFLSTFYSILLGHLANNFNFLLRSEFQKVMYCCTINGSSNRLQENAICKSFPNITVTLPGCQLTRSSVILLERAQRFLGDSCTWLGLP